MCLLDLAFIRAACPTVSAAPAGGVPRSPHRAARQHCASQPRTHGSKSSTPCPCAARGSRSAHRSGRWLRARKGVGAWLLLPGRRSWAGSGRRCTGSRGGVPAAGIAAAADASGVLRLRARARCLFASIRSRCSGDAPAASARLPAYRSPPVAAVAAGVVAPVAAADAAVRLARAAGAAAACPPARKSSTGWMRAWCAA